MASLDLTFINAGDNAELDVELDDSSRPEQIVRDLINEGFIPPVNESDRSYTLTIKGRGTIPEGETLAVAGVRSGDKIRVAVAQRGGHRE
jgi:hypothetical protein